MAAVGAWNSRAMVGIAGMYMSTAKGVKTVRTPNSTISSARRRAVKLLASRRAEAGIGADMACPSDRGRTAAPQAKSWGLRPNIAVLFMDGPVLTTYFRPR